MTQRLPSPGSDNGTWGYVLNGFLGVAHDSGGNLLPAAVTAAGAEVTTNKGAASGYAPLNSSSLVPTTNLGTGTAGASNYLRGDGTWVVPPAGVALDSTVADIQPDTTTGVAIVGSTGKAADAGHQHSLVSHDHSTSNKGGQITPTTGLAVTGTASSTTFLRGDNSWTTPPTASNATNAAPGLVQLSGDLGNGTSGTATMPQVTSTHLASALPINQGGTGSTAQNFVDLSSNQTIAGTKTFSSTITGSVSGNAATVTTNANLTGDVTSTGNATTVAKINGVTLPSSAPAANNVLTAASATSLVWQTPTVGAPSQAVASTTTTAGPLLVNKHNPVDVTTAGLTMTLPTGQAAGSMLSVEKYDATTNLVTISGSIRGTASATITLALQHETVEFLVDSSGSYWPVAGHKTLSTLDSRYTGSSAPSVTNIALQGKTGFYIPKDWGQYWRPKLATAAAGTGLARIAVVGDSISDGWYCSDPETKSWASGILRTSLQTAYGDGGSGFRSVIKSTIWENIASSYQTAWASSKSWVSSSGTWASDTSHLDGPGYSPVTSSTNASTLTFSVRGTTITVYYLQSTSSGTITVAVDGGSASSVSTVGSSKGVGVYSTTAAAGLHSVVVTVSGSTAVYVNGARGVNSTGVVVDVYPHPSQPSNCVNNVVGTSYVNTSGTTFGGSNSGTFGPGGLWSGGYSNPADLVIVEYGANDVIISGDTADTYIQNIYQYLVGVRNNTSASTDILLFGTHIGQRDTSFLYGSFMDRLRGLAESYGAALIDMWAIGGNSWPTWNALGYWGGSGVSVGTAGTDTIHWSDAGHAFVGNTIYSLVGGLS